MTHSLVCAFLLPLYRTGIPCGTAEAGHIPLLPRCPGAPLSAILRLGVTGCPTMTITEIPMTRALGLLMLCAAALPPVRAGEPVALFDGKDTARWYTFLRDHGKDKDPNGSFTVRDAILRIS